MGSAFGRKFVRNDKIEGQGKQLLLFAKKVRLQKVEVDRIFEEFCQIENPTTHIAEVASIFTTKKKVPTLITTLILQIFDLNKLGLLNFLEYMTAMWCFLSADEDELARMCFGLFDIYKTGSLDVGELKYLVNVVWEFNPNKRCLSALSKLDQNTDGVVTIPEFVLLNRHHFDLLRPLRDLQRHIQKKTVFKRFWKQITRRRVEDFGTQSMFEVCGHTETAYVASSMEYLNLRTDIVPPQYIEHWNFIQRRKATRGMLNQELPYEIKEILKPHPLNKHTKKTLKSVAKSMGLFSRYRRKSRKGSVSVTDDRSDAGSAVDEGEEGAGEQATGFESDSERGDDGSLQAMQAFPKKAKPFDDSFLGSLKGTKG